MPGPAARPKTLRYRAERWLRERDRRAGKYDRTKRLRDLIDDHHPWWDWGHRLMALVGRNDSGNWGVPRVRDLYFRRDYLFDETGEGKPIGYGLIVTRDAMKAWDGRRNFGEEWRTFDSQDDGHTIRIGWLGDDGRLHDDGINGRDELSLFTRWLLWDGWVKAEWFGLRRWLYYKGLSNAVDHVEPFSCGLTPPEGSGGYRHWHCTLRRPLWAILAGRRTQHPGPHRFLNYTWDEQTAGAQVEYEPLDDARGWRARR